MKVGTVALVVRTRGDGENPELLEAISDDSEITVLEGAYARGDKNPLQVVHELRDVQNREDDEFGNYVEELLSRPFVRPEIQKHGLEWLKSKIRIEQYRKTERDATEVIANYAYQVFLDDRSREDFVLAGPKAKVRIRVFDVAKTEAPRSQDVA